MVAFKSNEPTPPDGPPREPVEPRSGNPAEIPDPKPIDDLRLPDPTRALLSRIDRELERLMKLVERRP